MEQEESELEFSQPKTRPSKERQHKVKGRSLKVVSTRVSIHTNRHGRYRFHRHHLVLSSRKNRHPWSAQLLPRLAWTRQQAPAQRLQALTVTLPSTTPQPLRRNRDAGQRSRRQRPSPSQMRSLWERQEQAWRHPWPLQDAIQKQTQRRWSQWSVPWQ